MSLLETYFTYMRNPGEGMRKLMENRCCVHACLGYFVATLGWVLFFNIADGLSIPVLGLKLAIIFAAELIAGYFLAALCGLFLDLIRVKVSSAQLFVMIGSAGFIKALLIAFALISAVVPAWHLGWLAPLALLFVLALQLVYLVRGLQHMWGVDAVEAVGGWLFGFIAVGALFALVGIFFIWFVMLLV